MEQSDIPDKLEEQKRRATRREAGLKLLEDHGIPFVAKNDGAHLIIGMPAVLHFWPGTQRWIHLRAKHINGRGVQGLLDWIKVHQPSLITGESP